MKRRLAGLLLVTAALSFSPATADVDLGGFVQVNFTGRVTGEDCEGGDCDYLLGEERLQLELGAYSEDGSASFRVKVDLYHDAIADEPGIEFREGHVGYTSKYAGLVVGRRIITWGVGDLLFINDVFPKDWAAFFTGRPLEYLKVGSDALSVEVFTKYLDIEAIASPFFQPDRLPEADRFILPPSPFPPGLARREEQPKRTYENAEFHGRLSRYVSDWRLNLYASRTFFRTPQMTLDDPAAPTEIILFYPRLNVYGADAGGGLFGGVLSIEGGYYDSEEDRDGVDPAIENSMGKALLGYSHALWYDATLGAQAYGEYMMFYEEYEDSLDPGVTKRDKLRSLATLRFTQFLFHQTLTFNVFGFWGVSDEDFYLIPSLRYSFADPLWAEVGGNIFAGREDDTMFGALDDNDNVYLAARYEF